jgi:hypothetical protein
VIVQNAGQVNIASDGGQQVNVQRSKQGKRRAKKGSCDKMKSKRTSKTKPKLIAVKPPEESIRMKSASDAVRVK